jgi:hypothetical protein
MRTALRVGEGVTHRHIVTADLEPVFQHIGVMGIWHGELLGERAVKGAGQRCPGSRRDPAPCVGLGHASSVHVDAVRGGHSTSDLER